MKKKILIVLGVFLVIILIGVFFIFKVKVTDEEALNIAYRYINIDKSKDSLEIVHKDYLDGVYEITIIDDNYRYELEVSMRDGKIKEFEKELVLNGTNDNSGDILSDEEALEIVLRHIKANKNEVRVKELKLDYENGRQVYEIEVIYKIIEYEYEVDAFTGEILKYQRER